LVKKFLILHKDMCANQLKRREGHYNDDFYKTGTPVLSAITTIILVLMKVVFCVINSVLKFTI